MPLDYNTTTVKTRKNTRIIYREYLNRKGTKLTPLQIFMRQKSREMNKNNPDRKKLPRNIYRAKKKVTYLADNNFSRGDCWIGLTFPENTQDFDKCYVQLRKFTRSILYRYPQAKMLVVPEFQKRGSIHYHMMLSEKYTRKIEEELKEAWGREKIIKVTGIRDGVSHAGYLTKYLTKGSQYDEKIMFGRRSFYTFGELQLPEVIDTYQKLSDQQLKDLHEKADYSNTYEDENGNKLHFFMRENTEGKHENKRENQMEGNEKRIYRHVRSEGRDRSLVTV